MKIQSYLRDAKICQKHQFAASPREMISCLIEAVNDQDDEIQRLIRKYNKLEKRLHKLEAK